MSSEEDGGFLVLLAIVVGHLASMVLRTSETMQQDRTVGSALERKASRLFSGNLTVELEPESNNALTN